MSSGGGQPVGNRRPRTMTAAVSGDWQDVVATLRSDLEAVSDGGGEDEEARAATEELWSIVDSFEERAGSVDVEALTAVLGTDRDSGDHSIDVGAIPDRLVVEDPERAASLARLVSLIDLDDSTDYDIGRLWDGDGDARADDGTDASADQDDDTGTSPDSGEPADTTDTSEPAGADDTSEKLRSELRDALSRFRSGIEDAREGVADASASADDAAGSTDSGGEARATSGSDRTSSRSSGRSSTAVSTIPSNRADMGRRSHFSTVPGRIGGSQSKNEPSSDDDE